MKLKYLTKLLLLVAFCSFGNLAMAHNQDNKPDRVVTTIAQQSEPYSETETKTLAAAEKPVIPTTNVLHQNKRINLVVFVLAIIFVGIILYLIRIERKLNKLEKNIN